MIPRLRLSPLSTREEKTLKNIFVGNLDFGATEDTVRSLFEAYGTVERVSLMTDRETGRSRGFAFVEMTDTEEADRAITALNGANVGGRALNVNEARPKPAGGGGGRGPGGGGGFGGGGGRGGSGSGGPRQRREPRW
jgi:cold-inducible RNA-binding protein